MHYAIVNDTSGLIRQTGTCDPSHLHVKAGDGETARECANDVYDNTHRYVDGEFVLLPESSDDVKREEMLYILRHERASRLQSCDWTQAADVPLSDESKTEWAVYRQALRDLPNNVAGLTDINDVVFPTQPT